MKSIRITIFLIFICFGSISAFAQSFYRPWPSYTPVKPQKPYETIETLNTLLQKKTCFYKDKYYEPNQIITTLDIAQEETFIFFKECCSKHVSRCASDYIGTNNKTLLYTMVEQKAYRYMEWILTAGLYYRPNVDQWGVYNRVNDDVSPIRNYTPMMLACKKGDLTAAKILRINGAYLSQPLNAIGMTPYDFAIKYQRNNPDFLNYITLEYTEELRNIAHKNYYGKTFSMNDIIDDFFDYQEKNFQEKELRIIEKINELNKA